MAQGLFSSGTTSVARPTNPSTAAATTSLDTTDIVVTYTPSTIGSAATSFVASATTGATTYSVTSTSTATATITGAAAGNTYVVTVKPQNANGLSGRATTASTNAAVVSYTLGSAFTTSSTYTIPSGKTYMAAYIAGGGAAGQAGNQSSLTGSAATGQGGSGGGGGGAGWIKHIPVTAGEIYTVTVGLGGTANNFTNGNVSASAAGQWGNAGGLSRLTSPNSVQLATANGGSQATAGTFTTNVATAGLYLGYTAGAGGAGGSGGNSISSATAGGSTNTASFGIVGIATFTAGAGGGGGGGQGGWNGGNPGSSPAAADGGNYGGAQGAKTNNYNQQFPGSAGTAAGVSGSTLQGAGGGGGGGGGSNNSSANTTNTYQGNGGAGGTGYISIWVA